MFFWQLHVVHIAINNYYGVIPGFSGPDISASATSTLGIMMYINLVVTLVILSIVADTRIDM